MLEKRIISENPEGDIWKALLRYSFPTNIEKFMLAKHGVAPSKDLIDSVSGSMTQAEAYFRASKMAPLDISPLLTYYGSINLIAASCSLATNAIPNVKGHGANLTIPATMSKLGDVEIKPNNPTTGGIQIYADTFCTGTNLCTGHNWTLEEILGSIPDLKNEFENCYTSFPFSIPVEIVKMRKKVFERISNEDFSRFSGTLNWNHIKNFKTNYLNPQTMTDHILLNRKLSFTESGFYSISGRKYLEIGHLKGTSLIFAGQVMISLMGLYGLSYLSRYVPEVWTPFVRSDDTGERLLIERFLSVSQRQIPNAVLNLITNSHNKYVYEIDGITDLASVYSESDIKALVDEKVTEVINARNIKL